MVTSKPLSLLSTVVVATVLASCAGEGGGIVVAPSGPVPPTTTASTTPKPSAPASGDVDTLVHEELLRPGVRYRADAQIQDIDVVFTMSSTPLYAQASRRFVGLSTDANGDDLVLAILPAAGLRVFPSVDLEQADLERDAFGAVTDEAPADIVAWLQDRPFLGASPIDEHVRVGELEGRGFTYDVADLPDGALACGPAPAQRCAATFWAAGRSFHVAEGDAGQVVELDVAGQPMLVIARDDPAVAELVSTLTFDVAPIPAAADGAVRLPYFTPSVDPDVEYLVDKLARDVGLLVTAPADRLAASQRPEVVWFGDPDQPASLRRYVFTALDASNVVANTDPSLNPYAVVRPGGIPAWELDRFLSHTLPLPDDPARWLTELPHVVVDEGAHDTEIAGHPARVADVRAARLVDGLTCPDGVGTCVMPFAHGPDTFPIVISSEYVTRVVDVTIAGRRILIAADLGSPGEDLLASLRAVLLDG
jgi:hypothetical protein